MELLQVSVFIKGVCHPVYCKHLYGLPSSDLNVRKFNSGVCLVDKESVSTHSHIEIIVVLNYDVFATFQASVNFCNFKPGFPVSYTHLRAHETDSYLVC